MPQTQNAGQREGMGMGKGWAGCLLLEERTHANEQPPGKGSRAQGGGEAEFPSTFPRSAWRVR
jgi:hypothetical protein